MIKQEMHMTALRLICLALLILKVLFIYNVWYGASVTSFVLLNSWNTINNNNNFFHQSVHYFSSPTYLNTDDNLQLCSDKHLVTVWFKYQTDSLVSQIQYGQLVVLDFILTQCRYTENTLWLIFHPHPVSLLCTSWIVLIMARFQALGLCKDD